MERCSAPIWNEKYTFNVNDPSSIVKITVMSKGTVEDDI